MNNHDNEEKKNPTKTPNQIKISQLCFFLFLFKPLGLCARCLPQMAQRGPSRRAVGSIFPSPLGTTGTAGISGLCPLLLRGCGIVLVHGENYFSEAMGGEEAVLEPVKVGCTSIRAPDPTIYTVYTHTHLPAGRKSVPLFRFEWQGSIMGIKKKPTP